METSITSLWRLVGEGLAVSYRGAPDYEARLATYATLVLSGEPFADFNYVVIDAHPQAETRLREYADVIRSRNLPVIVIFTEAVEDQLAPVASELGLQDAGRIPLMIYEPAGAPQQDRVYQVKRIQASSEVTTATDIMCSAFGLPAESGQRAFNTGILAGLGVDMFMACCNGSAVSAVVTTRAGANVGIWAMATYPKHQRKGAGRALLDYMIAYHRERGAKLFYLLATEAGKPLYERIGFDAVTEASVWIAGHSTQVAGQIA